MSIRISWVMNPEFQPYTNSIRRHPPLWSHVYLVIILLIMMIIFLLNKILCVLELKIYHELKIIQILIEPKKGVRLKQRGQQQKSQQFLWTDVMELPCLSFDSFQRPNCTPGRTHQFVRQAQNPRAFTCEPFLKVFLCRQSQVPGKQACFPKHYVCVCVGGGGGGSPPALSTLYLSWESPYLEQFSSPHIALRCTAKTQWWNVLTLPAFAWREDPVTTLLPQ